jgi:ribonucleoside-diphosphate reductase alpha chain
MNNKQSVLETAVRYFEDDLAANVWFDKYCLKDKDKILEPDPDYTITRLATELSRIEDKYPNPTDYFKIYSLLRGFKKFVLGGSPMFGVGNNTTLSTLGSCFVIDSPYDSYGGILRADQELVQLMKRRGGVGMDISSLRPESSHVNNAANSSTGAVSFMSRFSNSTREVAQEGRRGALMITMDISHRDIEKFITSKDDLTKITGANISIRISDHFMKQVESDGEFMLHFNITHNAEFKARRVWNKIIHQAWKNAEPGVLFWDRILENSPADCYSDFKTISTNPCSELPLCAYDSCRLSAINIFEYVIDPFTTDAHFDFEQLALDTQIAQRMMDNLVDLEAEKIVNIIHKILTDPEDQDTKKTECDMWDKIYHKLMYGRRTGLGQMGLADAGAALNMKYGSTLFNNFSEQVNKIISTNSYMSSITMAKERGPFIAYDAKKEENHVFINKILNNIPKEYVNDYREYGRRNIANLTIAPTGSISILSGCTSGIEPVFALSYDRKRKVTEDNPNKSFQDKTGDWWETYKVYHANYNLWKELSPVVLSGEPLRSPYDGATAHDINPYTKLELQSRIQPWIDHSISVTYNLPNDVTEQQVSDLYMNAWKLGLKGLTVYRDGSRDGVLTVQKKTKFEQHDAPKRPKVLPHDVYSIMSKGHHWMVSIGILEGKPYEIFAFNNVEISGNKFVGEMTKLAKGRYDLVLPSEDRVFPNITNGCSDEENLLTRMISTSLRHGANIKFVVEQLNKSTGDITSFGVALARVLKRYVPLGTKTDSLCPDCGSILVYEGGCSRCIECGFSRCS